MAGTGRAARVVIAVIGDIVQSRQMDAAERGTLRDALDRSMTRINRTYRPAVMADFLVTVDDEFRGILRCPHAVPDIVQDLREQLAHSRTRLRIAVSKGELSTPLKTMALGIDGPAWRAARALLSGPLKAREGVAFAGFGDDNLILDGVGELLTHHWTHLEDSQREVVSLLRHNDTTRRDIADRLRISPQALSNRTQSAGWREFKSGIAAWRALLARHAI